MTLDEDGEACPNIIPMTAVPGKYESTSNQSSSDIQESTSGAEPDLDDDFDIYLHGNAALALNKLVATKNQVKVCISATKGAVLHPLRKITATTEII